MCLLNTHQFLPISLELKTGPTKTYQVQPQSGPCLLLCTHLLKCSPPLTRLLPTGFLVQAQTWALHPNIHMAYLSLPVTCLNVTSVFPSLVTLQIISYVPLPWITFLLTLSTQQILSSEMYVYVNITCLVLKNYKAEVCLVCLLLHHLCLKERPAHGRGSKMY